jgi:DNA-binding response OmpR family regulator
MSENPHPAVDDPPQSEVVGRPIGAKGYEVATAAASGAGALARIETERPDLVLLETSSCHNMSAATELRKILREPGHCNPAHHHDHGARPDRRRVKGLDAGADDFLTKPLNQPELLARVRSLLRIKQL